MKKFVLGLITVCLSICTLAFAGCDKSGENGMEKSLETLRSAVSFSVAEGNTTILQCNENTLYWKYTYSSGYDEYYFSPDDEGKYWVYEREYSADKWTKQAMSISEYYSYVYMIKAGLGIGDSNFFALIDCICLDFSACTTETDGKYTLVDGFYDNIVFWEDNGSLIFEYSYYNETLKYTVSSINDTKINRPESLTEAEVGEVYLP